MWFDYVERKRRAGFPASASAPRAFAAAPSFKACLRACICTFCMCVCTNVYVCMCVARYQCFGVWTVSCKHMCVRVHMYAYAYV